MTAIKRIIVMFPNPERLGINLLFTFKGSLILAIENKYAVKKERAAITENPNFQKSRRKKAQL